MGSESGETLTTGTVSAIQCNRAVIRLNWLRLLLHCHSFLLLFFFCLKESTDLSYWVISIVMWFIVLFLRQNLGQASRLKVIIPPIRSKTTKKNK